MLFVTGILASSCADKWDDGYNGKIDDGDRIVYDGNVYDFLASKPEYSKFLDFLETNNLTKELKKERQIMTVWAVKNENMPDSYDALFKDEDEVLRAAKHHLNYMKVTSDKWEPSKKIKMMSGKNVVFTLTTDFKYALDGKPVLMDDMMCSNGVVNELSGLMIPRDNAYEIISKLPDTYSRQRDTLLFQSKWVLDEEASYLLGYDDDGQPIYDPIYVLKNPFFDKAGDLTVEENEYTLILMSNEAIEDAYLTMFRNMGGTAPDGSTPEQIMDAAAADPASSPLTMYELKEIYDWIKHSFVYTRYYYNYRQQEEIRSPWDNQWKTKFQPVKSDAYTRGSNAVYYEIKTLHVPLNLFLKDIIFKVTFRTGDTAQPTEGYYQRATDEEKAMYLKHTGVGENAPAGATVNLYQQKNDAGNAWWWITLQPGTHAEPLWAEFTVCTLNSQGYIMPARFFPGTYDVECGFRPNNAPPLFIYFNGELAAGTETEGIGVGNLGGSTSAVSYVEPPLTWGKGKYEVTEAGTLVIRMECRAQNSSGTIANSGPEKRIAINGWNFYPNKDIY